MAVHYRGSRSNIGQTMLQPLYDFKGDIGCDVETVSLEDRTPIGAAFAIGPNDSWFFTIDSVWFPWFLLHDPRQKIVFHNAGFDVRILEDYADKPLTNNVDSCIAAQLIGLPAKLSELCFVLFGRTPRNIEDLIGKGKDQVTMLDVPIEKVAERGCMDAEDALEAWQALEHRVPVLAMDLETRFMPVALNIERKGIKIDIGKVHEHRVRLERDLIFFRMIAEGMGFNPGSSLQLAAMLEADGYKILYKKGADGKRRPKLNKEILETYYSVIPYVGLVLKYRSTQTLLTHLIKPLDDGRYIQGDRIYPRVNLNLTNSGRLSRSKPATQNLKENLRDIVVSEYRILDWDFSQIELRWAAWLWEDIAMQKVFAEGGDIHNNTREALILEGLGSVIGNTPHDQRRIAKDTNFLVTYGGDEQTMWDRKRIPIDIGKRIFEGFFKTYPGIANGIEKTKKFALANGYTETYLGRRRDMSDKLNSNSEYERGEALRALVNHVIQGSAAETMKEALYRNRDEPQFHTVHDEGLLDVDNGYQLREDTWVGVAPFETPITIKRGLNWRDVK